MGKLITYIALALVLVSGCKTIGTIERTYELRERYRDTAFHIEGGQVSAKLDSADVAEILAKLNRSQGKDTIIYRDRNGNAALKFYLDANGKLQAECDAKDRWFQAQIKDLQEKVNEKKVQVEYVEKIPWYCWVMIILLLLIIILQSIKRL